MKIQRVYALLMIYLPLYCMNNQDEPLAQARDVIIRMPSRPRQANAAPIMIEESNESDNLDDLEQQTPDAPKLTRRHIHKTVVYVGLGAATITSLINLFMHNRNC